MNIATVLTEQAGIRPDAPAITDAAGGRDRTLSFREIERASARIAALLVAHGLKRGDSVLVLQPMSAELYIALAALFRLGLVAVFLDPSAGRAHIARCCEMMPPRAMIGSAKACVFCLFVPELRRIPCKVRIGAPWLPGTIAWRRADGLAPREGFETCAEETPALITFTSGSTGRPKAALRSHGFLLAQHRALEQTIGLPAGTVEMATLPVFALANLAAGIHTLIPNVDLRAPGKIDPDSVLAGIDAHNPSRIVAPPAFLERVAERCIGSGRQMPSFRQIITGGAPVPPRLLDKLYQAAPQAEIVAVYGSTEAEPIAEITRAALLQKDRDAMLGGRGLLAGFPVPAIDLRILRTPWGEPIGPYTANELAAVCCDADEPGEIVVSGAHVLRGYLNGEGDAETKFRVDGGVWHRTGDSGCLDAAGRLWLLGRCSAIVTDSRGVLYPFAVEVAAQHQPGVQRAALHSRAGERILAVEPDGGATIDASALRAALGWAELDRVIVVKEIPVDKRHNSKVDYTALQRVL